MTTAPNKKSGLGDIKTRLLIAVLAIIIVGIGYWWYTTLEWEEGEIDLGYSREALQNDFLAAEIFLRQHGIQATTVKNLSLLDTHRWRNIELGRHDTLVLINANKTLDQDRYDSLYEWIENGGTLITSTQNPFIGTHTNEEDLLLSDFGITPAENHDLPDTRDLLKKIADGFDDDKDDEQANEESLNEKPADQQSQNGQLKSEPSAQPSANQNIQDQPITDQTVANRQIAEAKKTTSDHKSKKKNKGKEKPENYYRCNLNEQPTEIDFADEAKPLRFDFSNEAPFTYHYNNTDEDNDTDESAPDEDGIKESNSEYQDENTNSSNETAVTADKNSAGDKNSADDIAEENESPTAQTKAMHLLFFEIGDGSITITSDNYIWSNRRIDCHDHAYALWSLVNPNGRVWFLVNQDAPSLAAIIWEHAKYAVLAGLLALALWLWAKSTRFGPVFAVPQQGRRSLAEHIYASAMLLWRKQQHPQLLTLLRAEILERLAQQMLPVENTQQQVEFLHSLTGLTQADIQQALFTSHLAHPQEFTRAIAHLQLIRKHL